MRKRAIPVVALSLLTLSAPALADPQAAPAAAPPAATIAEAPAAAKDLAPIVVSVPKPQVWTFRKGDHTVLVLGTVYPEPQGLSFTPISIRRAIARSGAVIGPPWFHFSAHVNLFNVWSIWHASSQAVYLPDGKRLADVLPPADLQRWNALRARYLPHNRKVERMRPMYAGWKLYEAVVRKSGVAVDSAIQGVISKEAKARGIPMISGRFDWTVRDPKAAARAFQPDPKADLACFESILAGIESVPESSRTLAAAWAVGDVGTMQAYLATHRPATTCWSGMTSEAVARQQGLDRDKVMRQAWLAALDATAAKYPVVFTTTSVEDIFHPSWQVRWLLEDGYVMEPVETTSNAAPVPTVGANTGTR